MDERHRAAVPQAPTRCQSEISASGAQPDVSPAATQGGRAAPQTQSRFSSVCLLISNNEAGVRGAAGPGAPGTRRSPIAPGRRASTLHRPRAPRGSRPSSLPVSLSPAQGQAAVHP